MKLNNVDNMTDEELEKLEDDFYYIYDFIKDTLTTRRLRRNGEITEATRYEKLASYTYRNNIPEEYK